MSDFLSADAGIRQLHARFTDAVWRQDDAEFSGCFAEDGHWKIAGMEFHGREKIAEACRNMLGRCSHIHLIVGLPILEVTGSTAKGRLGMTEFARMQDGATAMTIGWYHDDYVEVGCSLAVQEASLVDEISRRARSDRAVRGYPELRCVSRATGSG